MRNYVVFIDESGTLPDVKDTVIVVGAVGTNTPAVLEKIITSVQKKVILRKPTGELKFYTSGDKTKYLFFEKLQKEEVDIFVLSVEKMGRKIPDTPEHFAILCWLLLRDVVTFFPDIGKIIIDRHFSRDKDIEQFNKALLRLLQKTWKITHVDSKNDKRVNAADMIAGATLAYETGKDKRFYTLLKERVISAKRLNWAEAKRKFLRNKKLA